jgi:site-specific recombinase XerC
MAALAGLHIEHLERRGRDELRIATVENLWRNLERHLGATTDVMTLTASHLERYEGQRRAETYHGEHTRGQTIRRERQALRKGLRLAKRDGLIRCMPFDWDDLDDIESDDAKVEQEAKVRELADINKALGALSQKAVTAGYDRMLRFILWTGLRLEEFRRFEPSWIKPAPKPVRGQPKIAAMLDVPASAAKIGDPRTLPLLASGLAVAKKWGHRFAGRKFNHALKLACIKAKVSPVVTPRDLRATYLDLAARHDPVAAQKLGGHRNISTTGLYLSASTARAVAAGGRAAKDAGGHRKGPQQQQRRRKAQ